MMQTIQESLIGLNQGYITEIAPVDAISLGVIHIVGNVIM